MAYDEKCKELASYFLQERPDSADAISGLAQAIQDAIEDWLHGGLSFDVEKAKREMRERLVVCDEVQTPHSYAVCSCTQGHTNPRIA